MVGALYRKDCLKPSISILDAWFYLDGADHKCMLTYASTLLGKVTVNWLHVYPLIGAFFGENEFLILKVIIYHF